MFSLLNKINVYIKVQVRRSEFQSSVVKPKPIKKDGDNPVNQSKLELITRSRHKARENVHARATIIGFGFSSDWLKKWRENFEPE